MKKSNYIIKVIIVTLLLMPTGLLAAASNQPGREGQTQNPETYPVKTNEEGNLTLAKQSLEYLVQQYQNENENAFFNNVSDRFLRQYLDFQIRVESDFRAFNVIRISYWIDNTEGENNRVNLSIHWEKSTQTPMAGAPVLTRGTSKLIFEIKDGKAYLVDQTGDNLFGATMKP